MEVISEERFQGIGWDQMHACVHTVNTQHSLHCLYFSIASVAQKHLFIFLYEQEPAQMASSESAAPVYI